MKIQDNKYFFESKYVEAFPCAYRGTYTSTKDNSTKIYNPEVRLNTERTATRQTGGIAGTESYIINLTENALECVVGGYYFNIKEPGWQKTVADYFGEKEKCKACKAIVSIVSKEYGSKDEQHYTTILAPLVEDGTVDDMVIDYVGCFVALAIVSATYKTGNDEYELKLLDSTGAKDSSSIFITDKIVSANGNGSIASADSSADGDHSFSFGSKITSSGDQSYIFGNSVIANGNNVLIVGNDHNGESYEDLVILGGSKVAATRNGQIIIGQVTDYDKDINIKDLLKINKDNEHFESSGLDITEKVLTFGDFKINNKANEKEITIFSDKCSFTEKETVIKNKLDLNGNIISTDGSATIKGKLTAENSLDVKKAEGSDKNAFTVTGGSELDTLTVTGVSKLKGEITISGEEDSGETTIDGGIITGKTATFDKITMSDQGVISVPSLNINGRNTASEIITCVLNTPTPGEGDQPALNVKSALTVDGTTNLKNTNLTGDISVQLSAKDNKFEIIDKDKKSLFSVKVVDLNESAEIKIDHLNINGIDLKGESGKLIVEGTISSNKINVTDTVEATSLEADSLTIDGHVTIGDDKIIFKKPVTFTSAVKAISSFYPSVMTSSDSDQRWCTRNTLKNFFEAFNVTFDSRHEYLMTGVITLCAMASASTNKVWGECVYNVNFLYKAGVLYTDHRGEQIPYGQANKYANYIKNWYWTTIDVTKPTGWRDDNRPFILLGPSNSIGNEIRDNYAWNGVWGTQKDDNHWPLTNTSCLDSPIYLRAIKRDSAAGCWTGGNAWNLGGLFDMSKTKLIITSITDYGEDGLATRSDASDKSKELWL